MNIDELNKAFEKRNLVEVIGYTLVGIAVIREHFKSFKSLIGTYANVQYNSLKDAEDLAKQYLIEILKEKKDEKGDS